MYLNHLQSILVYALANVKKLVNVETFNIL